MEYILDIILVVIFSVCVAVGYKRGFVKSFTDLVSNIIALIGARVISVQYAPKVFSLYFEEKLSDVLRQKLSAAGGSASAQVQSALDSIPDALSGFLSLMGVDKEELTGNLTAQLSEKGADIVKILMTDVISPIMVFVLKALLFAASFAFIILLLKLISLILNKLAVLPVLKQANKGLGIAFGAVKGVVVVLIICIIAEILAGFIDSQPITQIVSGSRLVSVFGSVVKGFAQNS